MSIKHFIVHKAIRNPETKKFESKLRKKENPIDGLSETVTSKLVKLFNKTSLSSGCFLNDKDDNNATPQFAHQLNKYWDGNNFTDFVTFTRFLTDFFYINHLSKSNAKGGYLLFYHIERDNKDNFLSVVLLNNIDGFELSDDLDFGVAERLELEHIHLGARINLTSWKEGLSTRYISFRQGKTSSDMREYFTNFIGCDEFTEEKEDTESLIAAIQEMSSNLNYDDTKIEKIKESAFDYCKEKKSLGDPIELEVLSKQLFPENHEEFIELSQEEPYNLSSSFSVNSTTLNKLVRYRGNSKDLRISFNHNLLGNDIEFDPVHKHLKIKNLPKDLLSQLMTNTIDE
jgi:nucleoid-associated protein